MLAEALEPEPVSSGSGSLAETGREYYGTERSATLNLSAEERGYQYSLPICVGLPHRVALGGSWTPAQELGLPSKSAAQAQASFRLLSLPSQVIFDFWDVLLFLNAVDPPIDEMHNVPHERGGLAEQGRHGIGQGRELYQMSPPRSGCILTYAAYCY